MSSSEKSEVPIYLHHTAIKTRDIETCIQFYSLFGFEVDTKFRAGSERAAWLSHDHGTRLEVLELPTSLLNEPSGMKRRALDLMQHPQLLGFNHLALDVTESMRVNEVTELQGWLDRLNETSLTTFGKTLRIAVPPRQQIIGNGVYQLAFLYDADGALVELIRKQCILEQPMDDGWAPWDANDVQLSLDFDLENSKE